jgi:hypothetical protein
VRDLGLANTFGSIFGARTASASLAQWPDTNAAYCRQTDQPPFVFVLIGISRLSILVRCARFAGLVSGCVLQDACDKAPFAQIFDR